MSYVSEALEKQLEAYLFLERALVNPSMRPGVTFDERQQWKTDMLGLQRAEPFFWNRRTVEFVSTAMQDFKLPDIICSRSLLYDDFAWHWFSSQEPFLVEEYKTKRLLPIRAISWYWYGAIQTRKQYLGATAWAQSAIHAYTGVFTGPLVPVLWACVEQGAQMSTGLEEGQPLFEGLADARTVWEASQLKAFVLCASTFLRQELLTAQVEKVERHARKRVEKAGMPRSSGIQVVQLRRTLRTSTGGEESGEKPDWQFQWTVRGHVRQQFYKTLNEHLPVYIHPYLKGPEDKPLKPRTTPIYSVTR